MMGMRSANSYFKDWASQRPPFIPDGVGVAVVVDRGRTFDYLSWYTTAMLDNTWTARPSLPNCLVVELRRAASGTLSRTHLKRMSIDTLGRVELRPDVTALLPPARSTDGKAISDVSLCNVLNLSGPDRAEGTARRLADIVAT
jgi:hypothetical protein